MPAKCGEGGPNRSDQAYQKQHPDLMPTDIMMPKLDGFGLRVGASAESKLFRQYPRTVVEGLSWGAGKRLSGAGTRRKSAHVAATYGPSRILKGINEDKFICRCRTQKDIHEVSKYLIS